MLSLTCSQAVGLDITYEQQFLQEEFWRQKQYLIWFHGKDIQKEMQKQEPNYISLASFFDWAITQLDITQYPDLMDYSVSVISIQTKREGHIVSPLSK